MNGHDRLRKRVEQQARRMKQAEKNRRTLISQAVFIGTLGLVFVLPVVAGAYLGLWLDDQAEDYSIRWTLGLILLGVIIGALNVYLFIRE